MAAVAKHGASLKHAAAKLCGDPDVVLAAVSQDGTALKFANADMKGNPDIVYAAAMRHIRSLKHASAELRSSYEFMLLILENCGTAWHGLKETALDHAFDELRIRPELQVLAVQRQQEALARQTGNRRCIR